MEVETTRTGEMKVPQLDTRMPSEILEEMGLTPEQRDVVVRVWEALACALLDVLQSTNTKGSKAARLQSDLASRARYIGSELRFRIDDYLGSAAEKSLIDYLREDPIRGAVIVSKVVPGFSWRFDKMASSAFGTGGLQYGAKLFTEKVYPILRKMCGFGDYDVSIGDNIRGMARQGVINYAHYDIYADTYSMHKIVFDCEMSVGEGDVSSPGGSETHLYVCGKVPVFVTIDGREEEVMASEVFVIPGGAVCSLRCADRARFSLIQVPTDVHKEPIEGKRRVLCLGYSGVDEDILHVHDYEEAVLLALGRIGMRQIGLRRADTMCVGEVPIDHEGIDRRLAARAAHIARLIAKYNPLAVVVSRIPGDLNEVLHGLSIGAFPDGVSFYTLDDTGTILCSLRSDSVVPSLCGVGCPVGADETQCPFDSARAGGGQEEIC